MAAIEDRISGLNDGELDTFESGITRLDRAGTVRFSNKAEERFTKRKAEDTMGSTSSAKWHRVRQSGISKAVSRSSSRRRN